MGVLSKRQEAEATQAANKHLDGTALVQRGVDSDTPTGKSRAQATIYQDIPCHIDATTSSNPTSTEEVDHGVSDLDFRAYLWLPTEWLDATQPDPKPTIPVVIKLGDAITVEGKQWLAITDEDPSSGFRGRVRVRVGRTHDKSN